MLVQYLKYFYWTNNLKLTNNLKFHFKINEIYYNFLIFDNQ